MNTNRGLTTEKGWLMPDSKPGDDDMLQSLEIDLEVAECGEILEAHGVTPTVELVTELWDWMESLRTTVGGA